MEEKNPIPSEIKKYIQGTNSGGKETRTQIDDLEQKEKINMQLEQNEETRTQKNEERLRNIWDNFKCSDIQITGVPKGEEEEQQIENIFEKNNERKLPQFSEGNRHTNSGSSQSPKQVGPKKEHTKTYHN